MRLDAKRYSTLEVQTNSQHSMKRSQPAGPRQALDDTQPATPPTARKSHCEDHNIDCESNTKDMMMDEAAESSVHFWVKQILYFLEKEGQNLLTAICARYKIPYDGTIASIPDGMLEQVAYNAIFNPALPKGDDSLPLMLRNVDGVTAFRLSFLKDRSGIFKSNLVTAKLDGRPFSLECRACSYCGSCFSGRFMELDSTHQRAGGWKEITDKIHAGKYSWKALKGWRLCVPCFTNYGQKGTMDNANRLSIKEVIKCSPADLKEGWCDSPPGKNSPIHSISTQRESSFSSNRRRADSEPETPRPSKRARGRERGEAREQYETVEVLADGDWWDAHVIEVAADGSRLVHYVGGTADEDEWIARGSPRIRSAGSAAHTDASNAPTPAPSAYTPQVTPLVAPMKDRDVSLPPCGALSLSPQDSTLTMPASLRTPSVSPVLCPKEPTHAMEGPELLLDEDKSELAEPRMHGVEDLFSSEQEDDDDEYDDDDEQQDFGVSTVVEVLKRPLTFGERTGVVEVSVAALGPELSYQWFEGDEAIPGAEGRVLKLLNSGELGGRISCRVSNAYGDAWAVCPVLLPSTPEAAEDTCKEAAGFFLLKCRCGTEMEGSPTVLCETPCSKCGAVCCGKIQRA